MQIPKYFYFLVRCNDRATIEVEDASDRDVEEVVRCKYCKHYDTDEEYNSYLCKYFRAYRTPEDFCSDGKRKESEE